MKTFVNNKNINTDSYSYAKLPYLIRQYSVSYQYSAQFWYKLAGQPPANEAAKILALAPEYVKLDNLKTNKLPANLVNLRNNLVPLSGTKQEVNWLENQFQGHYLYDKSANEQEFKTLAPQYNVLHLAMHGLVNEEQPDFSSLAFSEHQPNNQLFEDNFLNSYEIKSMSLHADLVVLSACETAYGKYERGEGAISIGRSFFITVAKV